MLNDLTTEGRNPASEAIDRLTALDIVRLMNTEDARVPEAVAKAAESIAQAIEVVADRLRRGGRLIYIGAGTSGRLGVLDASECPPTFNTKPEQVVGLIAGGHDALTRAIEGAEDDPNRGADDLKTVQVSANDVVVGIATSGRTPYVSGGLEFARSRGIFTIGLACNPESRIAAHSDLMITVVVGPEVISGSTRLKAGTATKLVLNMLTTGAMVLLGKTYGNLMVDLKATNSKLVDRTRRIVTMLTDLTHEQAEVKLAECDGELKTAIVSQRCNVSPADARRRLKETGGHLRRAIEMQPARTRDRRISDHAVSDGHLVLGIDGGGTKTVAWLAERSGSESNAYLGEGRSGPSNPQAVGFTAMRQNLDQAIDEAFRSAGLARQRVAAICLALAGSDRPNVRCELDSWAVERNVADRTTWIHDGLATLWGGCSDGCGIALIAGTGSIVFGRNRMGQTARCGGWGYLIGDEGSGFAIAQAGLRAVAQAIDGRGAKTQLQPMLLQCLGLQSSNELVNVLHRSDAGPALIARCAEQVLDCAVAGDDVACHIVGQAARELALGVATVAQKLQLNRTSFQLAISGGALINSSYLRDALMRELTELQVKIESTTIVASPVQGAVTLARRSLLTISS